MFSLSTSWNYGQHRDNGAAMIKEIKEAGFNTVELNFALTAKMVNDIAAAKDGLGMEVSSLHNMCPLPDEIPISKASPDFYSLAAKDENQRSLAVAVARNTILYARKLSAKAVILHAGRVEIKDRTRELASVFNDKDKAGLIISDMIKDRRLNRAGHLDSIVKSLKELVPYAKEAGVCLGIENRYYYREIPVEDEFEMLFNEFAAGDIFYWHDAGHAEVFDRLGLSNHKDMLDKFSGRLLGMHLHDIIGLIDDHRSPGFGTFGFELLRPYIKADTIKVLEVHEPASADEIVRGAKYITKVLG